MDAARITSQLSSSQLTQGIEGLSRKTLPTKEAGATSESFSQDIGEALSNANRELNQAEASTRELAAGKGDIVETMINLGRADLSLRMVVNMRNRMLESYQEIMRLQV